MLAPTRILVSKLATARVFCFPTFSSIFCFPSEAHFGLPCQLVRYHYFAPPTGASFFICFPPNHKPVSPPTHKFTTLHSFLLTTLPQAEGSEGMRQRILVAGGKGGTSGNGATVEDRPVNDGLGAELQQRANHDRILPLSPITHYAHKSSCITISLIPISHINPAYLMRQYQTPMNLQGNTNYHHSRTSTALAVIVVISSGWKWNGLEG